MGLHGAPPVVTALLCKPHRLSGVTHIGERAEGSSRVWPPQRLQLQARAIRLPPEPQSCQKSCQQVCLPLVLPVLVTASTWAMLSVWQAWQPRLQSKARPGGLPPGPQSAQLWPLAGVSARQPPHCQAEGPQGVQPAAMCCRVIC